MKPDRPVTVRVRRGRRRLRIETAAIPAMLVASAEFRCRQCGQIGSNWSELGLDEPDALAPIAEDLAAELSARFVIAAIYADTGLCVACGDDLFIGAPAAKLFLEGRAATA